MGREMPSQGSRCSLIKQDLHSRNVKGPHGVIKYPSRLLQSNAWEPFQKFRNLRAVFKILE